MIAGSAVAALALFVVVGVFTPLMGVREIEIVGASSLDVSELEQSLERLDGVPLAAVNDSDVAQALERFPLVQRYAVERVPPHTLRVRIVERVPVLAIENGDALQHFDAAGVHVGSAEGPVEGVPKAQGGTRQLDSAAFEAGARIVRDMPADLRDRMVEVKASGDQDVTFTTSDGLQVVWGSAEDTRRKAVVLRTLLDALGGRSIELIDVSSPAAPIFR